MDFDETEHERINRDGQLAERYALNLPQTTGNLYLMPLGKLVNAEDMLYKPSVILEDAEKILKKSYRDDKDT